MINWDDLKHIHVIRKLEQILAQWFNTEIFFVDEKGFLKNHDLSNIKTEFKNPLFKMLLKSEVGREKFLQSTQESNETLFNGSEKNLVITGPFGFEKAFVSQINVEGEYLGCVYAYSYLEDKVSSSDQKKSQGVLKEIGVKEGDFSTSISEHRVLSDSERKYFFELVDLVAQEIVTFHTEISKREERISALNNQLGERYKYDSMIGKSKPMQDVYSLLDKIKVSESTILIQGENGTGKELIAKAVHFNSPRKDAPFVTVNCSAFNENLLDSELFGHVRGSFTGAVKDKKGLFEQANRGTLFLDEIGDMSLSMQVKLLRVLQEGALLPVGGAEERKVDVRVLTATNKDLKSMVEQGTFREDLYYRINVINIVVPPLRDRKEDIPLLIDHFMIRGCKEKSVDLKTFAKRAYEKIYDYPWPGNIRELENEVERLIVLSGNDKRISAELLSARIKDYGGGVKSQGLRVSGKLKDALEELERTMIKEGLRRTKWNKSRLAKELGISRAGLIMKVEKYGLDKRKVVASSGGSSDSGGQVA